MKGERLGEFEEMVLLAVRGLHDDATGLAIQTVLEREAGRFVSLGAIYAALDRMTRKGFVESQLGAPTPTRGGRRKRYYRVTRRGTGELRAIRDVRERLWRTATAAGRRS